MRRSHQPPVLVGSHLERLQQGSPKRLQKHTGWERQMTFSTLIDDVSKGHIAKPDQKYEFLVSDFRCNLMGLVGLVHKGPGIYEDD